MPEVEVVLCFECGQASRIDEWGRRPGSPCPNPACRIGNLAFRRATCEWEQARDEAWEAVKTIAGVVWVFDGWGRAYEREHPRPRLEDYANQPTFGMWRVAQ